MPGPLQKQENFGKREYRPAGGAREKNLGIIELKKRIIGGEQDQ